MKQNHLATESPHTVLLQNINRPGSLRKVDSAMATAMQEALLACLPQSRQGLTLEQLRSAVLPMLPQHLFPGGAKSGWWLKAVQLDLEAKCLIVRDKGSPLRLRLA